MTSQNYNTCSLAHVRSACFQDHLLKQIPAPICHSKWRQTSRRQRTKRTPCLPSCYFSPLIEVKLVKEGAKEEGQHEWRSRRNWSHSSRSSKSKQSRRGESVTHHMHSPGVCLSLDEQIEHRKLTFSVTFTISNNDVAKILQRTG